MQLDLPWPLPAEGVGAGAVCVRRAPFLVQDCAVLTAGMGARSRLAVDGCEELQPQPCWGLAVL